MKRAAPMLALLLLAPWVGEFLLGNISLRRLPGLLILVLLYGCGALLIREVTLRTGRGWPTILLLGAAYGVIEAGIVDQAMFNPSFEGWEFQAITPVPPLGISAWYAWTFVVGHSVWSIAVPIALVELLFPARARTPWLGRVGLVLTAAGYVAGCVVIGRFVNGSERFLASPSQLAGAARGLGRGVVLRDRLVRVVRRSTGAARWPGSLGSGRGGHRTSWRWSQRRSGRTPGSGSYSPRWWSPATRSAGPATSCSPPLRSHSSLLRAAAFGPSPRSHGHKDRLRRCDRKRPK